LPVLTVVHLVTPRPPLAASERGTIVLQEIEEGELR
jgi:hypothetical protein